MPYGKKTDPTVTRISVYPAHRLMPRQGKQQLLVLAHYSDDSTREVTQTAQYEPNNKDLAEVDEDGRVTTHGRPGDVAIMVRYQSQVAVYAATIPLGVPVKNLPKVNNFIDEHVFRKLKQDLFPQMVTWLKLIFILLMEMGKQKELFFLTQQLDGL